MSQLTAFVGVTGLVITGFLVLARLSQRVVDDADPDPSDDPGTHGVADDPGTHGVADDPATPDVADPDGRGAPGAPASAGTHTPGDDDTWAPQPVDRDRASPVPGQDHPPDGTPRVDTAERRLEGMSPGALLANVALTQGLFGALLAAAAWYFEVPTAALGLTGGAIEGPLAVGVGVGFGLALWLGNEVASAAADAAGAAYDEQLRTLLAPDTARGWLVLLGGTLPIIALVEEFLFRAAAIGAAAATLPVSPWALAVVSSVAFGIGHGAQGRVGVLVTGALGFTLAAGFVLTGSFVVVVVAHYLVNALEFGLHEGLGLPDPVWS